MIIIINNNNNNNNNSLFCCRDLKRKVSSLNTGGTTALGPALALCVGMASNFSTAEIILCTDGVSNVGVGKLSGNPDTGFYLNVCCFFFFCCYCCCYEIVFCLFVFEFFVLFLLVGRSFLFALVCFHKEFFIFLLFFYLTLYIYIYIYIIIQELRSLTTIVYLLTKSLK